MARPKDGDLNPCKHVPRRKGGYIAVSCEDDSKCDTCGWNPAVKQARLDKLRGINDEYDTREP